MATDRYAATMPRRISDWEEQTVAETLRLFNQLVVYRNIHAGQCEETAALILPTFKNTFFYGSYNFPGLKKTQQQVDANGARALHRFVAIVNSLVTPRNLHWHALEADDPYVMKDRATKLWFEQATATVFRKRYDPLANFFHQNKNNWQSLGAFGNHVMFIDKLDGRLHHGARGLRYRGVPFGETFFAENHQGVVTTMVRWFRGTAAQAAQKWGTGALPATLRPSLEMNSQNPFNFLHCVKPRDEDEYDPEALDERGKPFESYYVSMEGMCLLPDRDTGALESGYDLFPYAVGRYEQAPGEVYGRGPAQIVLPALKTLNAEKVTYLTIGHRAANPVYLLADDGMMSNWDARPGAKNPGGVTPDGKPLVHTLPPGDFRIAKEMIADEKEIIDDVFMVELFKVLRDNPNMKATQVIELVNERGMLTAPTLGGQFEYVSQMTEREIALLMELDELPPMPPRLREARGAYRVTDTSPLAMAAKSGSVAGAMRVLDQVNQIASITQDMSLYDYFDFETLIPEAAEIQGMPVRWMATADAIKGKQKGRAQAQQRQQQIEAMPGQAALMNAQAKMAQSGQQPQQGMMQ